MTISCFSTVSAASSLRESDASANCSNANQLILLSEKFKESLLLMERRILGNIFQPKLAAYRRLPALQGKLSLLSHDASTLRIIKMLFSLVTFTFHSATVDGGG